MELKDTLPKVLYSEKRPTVGEFKQGDRVINIRPTAENPVGYWLRITTGNTHVLDTDWVEK